MSRESGGAAPRRGHRFQDYAAAYFFVSDEPTFRSCQPLELHIEQDDADFYYVIRNSKEFAHYFEVKEKQSGELKWGEFKSDVLTEYVSILEESPRYSDTDFFHTVVNTTFASKISNLHSDSKDLREGEPWPKLSTKGKRTYGKIQNKTGADEDTLYKLIWGLFRHSIRERELKDRLDNYLRDCVPREWGKAREIILNKIHETDKGVIRRSELGDEIGTSLEPIEDSTSGKSPQELKESVEKIPEDYSSTENKAGELASDKSSAQEYAEWLSGKEGIGQSVVETHAAQLEETFEERIDIEKRKSELDSTISRITEEILGMDDSTSSGDENNE